MKRLMIILFLGGIAAGSSGQFYVQPSAGYSFSSHPSTLESVFITDNQKTIFTAPIKYGESLNAGLTVGYELWDHLMVELNVRQAVYSKHTATIEEQDLATLDNYYIAGFYGEIEYKSPALQFAPQIGYKVQKDKLSAYFSLGPHFMITRVTETARTVDYDFVDWRLVPFNVMIKREFRGGLHTGLQADLGFSYDVGSRFQVVLDFSTVYNNYVVKVGEITGYEVEGSDRLESLDDTDVEIDPEDNRLNHSNYGLNIGLRYVFGRNKD